MRLSNETRTLNNFLKGFEQDNNIAITLVRFEHFDYLSYELSFIDLDNLDFYINYELVLINEDIRKYSSYGLRRDIDISNFEIKVLSPIDHLAKKDVYEYWNLENELQEFIDNRFFG